MVIGEVEATPGGLVIKVVKVQDLSADPVAKLSGDRKCWTFTCMR